VAATIEAADGVVVVAELCRRISGTAFAAFAAHAASATSASVTGAAA
jgi:hypothetical protein